MKTILNSSVASSTPLLGEPRALTKSRRGRPRTFDKDVALTAAMLLFWERGYEGVSMDDLTKAMAISPSSLYASFGSKEELFLKTLDKYEAELHGRQTFAYP